MNHHPEILIKAIRQSFIGAEQVYTDGSCVAFYFILKAAFPAARPYWSKKAKHMITKIGNDYYDITGKVKWTPDYELDEDEYGGMAVAVAFPLKQEKRVRFTTPKKMF